MGKTIIVKQDNIPAIYEDLQYCEQKRNNNSEDVRVTKNNDESEEDSFMISWSESYGSSREPFLEKQAVGNVQD